MTEENYKRFVYRGVAVVLAALSLAGTALAAPVETVLYSFTGGSDGINPFAGLIFDKEGALYGTTVNGGSGNVGTVFKLTPPAKGRKTWTETVLYSFRAGGSDGISPEAGLIFDKEGGTLRHNLLRCLQCEWLPSSNCICWLWHSFQADAAYQIPKNLDRERAL
jgi:uncharacterized repeat protein (TIGR03803 family)